MRPRDNPFRTERVAALRFRPAEKSWDELLHTFDSLRFRAAIVGPHGSGKTTLMDDIEQHLSASGRQVLRLQLNTSTRKLSRTQWRELKVLRTTDFVLLDGAEQLNYLHWKYFLRQTRRAGGVLITSHRSGLLPTLIECHTSPELLQTLIEELLTERKQGEYSACPEVLWKRHEGNLRNAFRELYDHYAGSS
jgi:hypothetical protein